MKISKIGTIAATLVAALVAQADVMLDFSGGSASGTSFTYTFSDLGGNPVTMTPGTASSGALTDPNQDTLTYGGGSGTFTLSVSGYLTMNTATWTPGTQSTLAINSSGTSTTGLNVSDSSGALRKGETLLFTVSIDPTLQTYLTSNGYSLRLTEFAAGTVESGATLTMFTQAGGATAIAAATPGSLVASPNTILTDGMQFALINVNSVNTADSNLASIAVDVIPEPATLGMVAATGLGILFIRRRIMM